MATMDKDFQSENWWSTVSGAGTDAAVVPSWADDYTRHRSGELTHSGTTYGSVDMYKHSGNNQPIDVYIGRKNSIEDVNP
jgi:hypothetical protein